MEEETLYEAYYGTYNRMIADGWEYIGQGCYIPGPEARKRLADHQTDYGPYIRKMIIDNMEECDLKQELLGQYK